MSEIGRLSPEEVPAELDETERWIEERQAAFLALSPEEQARRTTEMVGILLRIKAREGLVTDEQVYVHIINTKRPKDD